MEHSTAHRNAKSSPSEDALDAQLAQLQERLVASNKRKAIHALKLQVEASEKEEAELYNVKASTSTALVLPLQKIEAFEHGLERMPRLDISKVRANSLEVETTGLEVKGVGHCDLPEIEESKVEKYVAVLGHVSEEVNKSSGKGAEKQKTDNKAKHSGEQSCSPVPAGTQTKLTRRQAAKAREEAANKAVITLEDAGEEVVRASFYQPSHVEKGDPMKDEGKLRSFNGPLVGYEASGRVPVALKPAGPDSQWVQNSTTHPVSPLIGNQSRHGDKIFSGPNLAGRALRHTSSNLEPFKPKWNTPNRAGRGIASTTLRVHVPKPHNTTPLSGKSVLYYYASSPSSGNKTTHSFGAVGDGRSPLPSSLSANTGFATVKRIPTSMQTPRSPTESAIGKSPISQLVADSSPEPEPRAILILDHLDSQRNMDLPMVTTSDLQPRPRRRRSFSGSIRPIPFAGSAIAERTEGPDLGLAIADIGISNDDADADQVPMQQQPSLTTMTSGNAIPPVWKREGLPFSWKAGFASGEGFAPFEAKEDGQTSDFDPPTFSLPYGSTVVVMKSASMNDVRASIKEEVWTSTHNAHMILKRAWNARKEGELIILIFSQDHSNKYCGLAEMSGAYDPNTHPDLWENRSNLGAIPIRWIVVKDVPFERFSAVRYPRANGPPTTEPQNGTQLSEDVGRLVAQSFFEAPHSHATALSSGALSGSTSADTATSPDIGNTSCSPSTLRTPSSAGFTPTDRFAGYRTHRPFPILARPGRVVGATNYGYGSDAVHTMINRGPPGARPGRVVGATNYGHGSDAVHTMINRGPPGATGGQNPTIVNVTNTFVFNNGQDDGYTNYAMPGSEPDATIYGNSGGNGGRFPNNHNYTNATYGYPERAYPYFNNHGEVFRGQVFDDAGYPLDPRFHGN